jgi:hypothetical protein
MRRIAGHNKPIAVYTLQPPDIDARACNVEFLPANILRKADRMRAVIAEPLLPLAAPIDNLTNDPDNANRGDVAAIRKSLNVFGQRKPVVVRRTGADAHGRPTGIVIAGNHTLAAATELGWDHVAAVFIDDDANTAKAYALADNRTGELASWDNEQLAATLRELGADDFDLTPLGWTNDQLAELLSEGATDDDDRAPGLRLADRFMIPPFTVLDGRSGWWTNRRRQWRAMAPLGSPDGRAEHLAYNTGKTSYMANAALSGTSLFDPVLCEIVYRWFSPSGGTVLDPWAGGPVRGLVAACLGRPYVGVELRAEQVAANIEQTAAVFAADGALPRPQWLTGDCARVLPTLPAHSADLLLGCPPYFDLERYGDDPADLSTMTDEDFRAAYRGMIAAAVGRLRPDRFAVLVVGAVRDPRTGHLRDLRGLTVDAAADAGLALYNEAVLVTPAGSLPMRAGKQFASGRILGRTHQDVLVFVKGDRKRAAAACGHIDPADLDAALELAGSTFPDDETP